MRAVVPVDNVILDDVSYDPEMARPVAYVGTGCLTTFCAMASTSGLSFTVCTKNRTVLAREPLLSFGRHPGTEFHGFMNDAQLTHDALFLFLLQEAEGCPDLDVLESQVAVVSEHLQIFLDDLASAIANAAEDSSDGDQP